MAGTLDEPTGLHPTRRTRITDRGDYCRFGPDTPSAEPTGERSDFPVDGTRQEEES